MIKVNKQILSTIQFDCGDNDLNEFLLKDSFKNLENSLSKIIIYIIFIKIIIRRFNLWQLKVEPTPTLTGDDADRFIQKLNIPSTEEEIKALKRAKKNF